MWSRSGAWSSTSGVMYAINWNSTPIVTLIFFFYTVHVCEISLEFVSSSSFSIQTALKMLDYHFPDEHVRQFAVNALDKMPDDQLEDILLQLTQVCVCMYAFFCLCVCLSVCLSVRLSVYVSTCLSVRTYILCITVVNLLSLPQNNTYMYIRKYNAPLWPPVQQTDIILMFHLCTLHN